MRNKIQVNNKIRISNTVRKVIIFACVAVIAISSGNLLKVLTNKEEAGVKEHEVYNYKNKFNSSSNINLKKNEFVTEEEMLEDQAYLSDLISSIDMGIKYKYLASSETKITYSYKIEAIVKATYTNSSNSYDVLNKSEVLKEVKNQTIRAKEFDVDENINVDYEKYHAVIKDFKQSMGINTDSNLLIVFTVNTKTSVGSKEVENKYVSTYKITVGDKVAVVDQIPEDETSDVVMAKYETNTIRNVNYQSIIVDFVIIAICLLIIRYVLMDTEDLKAIKNEFKLELNKIMKAYGDKIVEIQDMNQIDVDQATQVKDIMQLRKLAEEALVPIYCFIENDEIAYFIVTKYENNYIYVLR